MAISSKVFIYNGQGASEESAADLKELFSSETIFKNQPDVHLCDFSFNMQGITTPTFVVPGGSTIRIGAALKPQMESIRSSLGEDFNYVGVCAGAFLGTIDADLFYTSHKLAQNQTFEPSTYLFTSQEANVGLGLLSEYKAIGAFYPNNDHIESQPKDYMPYRVTVKLSETNEKLSQLYVAGPGFFSINDNEKTNLVATYTDCDSYHFTYPAGEKTISELPAMICKKPTNEKGGILLSGTHIEACVSNSKFLSFFTNSTAISSALSATDCADFIDEQKETEVKIQSILRSILK